MCGEEQDREREREREERDIKVAAAQETKCGCSRVVGHIFFSSSVYLSTLYLNICSTGLNVSLPPTLLHVSTHMFFTFPHLSSGQSMYSANILRL